MIHLSSGASVPIRHIRLLSGHTVDLTDGQAVAHLQFRRFAGCPVCDPHLRSFVRRRAEVDSLLREIIVFHSRPEERAANAGDIPFLLVADPKKRLYAAYGAEGGGFRALLHPGAMAAISRAGMTALREVLFYGNPCRLSSQKEGATAYLRIF